MFKRFLSGIVFGVGFGIAVIVVLNIYFKFFFNSMLSETYGQPEEVTETPPAVSGKVNSSRYLGTNITYSSDFSRGNRVLSTGPGKISGSAILNNIPLPGLKLRLALNGEVYSQWVVTDSDGKYHISVPYGNYKIDGFELDENSSNSVLAGKIMRPHDASSSGVFEVTEDLGGRGLTFRFVDPVEKNIMRNKFSLEEDIVISWKPYKGAHAYQIQIFEKDDAHSFHTGKNVFHWSKRPSISETSFSLKENNVPLKANHFYRVDITALDKDHSVISETPRNYIVKGFDFEVLEPKGE